MQLEKAETEYYKGQNNVVLKIHPSRFFHISINFTLILYLIVIIWYNFQSCLN